jgi:hypothetical protein
MAGFDWIVHHMLMRRVREYLAANLSESTELTTLAAGVGLSIHHFADDLSDPPV